MDTEQSPLATVGDRLAELYDKSFGGKQSGRYRIPAKLVRRLAGRRRLYEDDIRELTRLMLERGYVLVDMESFFVVMSANTFVNYRRANEDCIG
jgi:hypothetical protein